MLHLIRFFQASPSLLLSCDFTPKFLQISSRLYCTQHTCGKLTQGWADFELIYQHEGEMRVGRHLAEESPLHLPFMFACYSAYDTRARLVKKGANVDEARAR